MNENVLHKKPLWRRIGRKMVLVAVVLCVVALLARMAWGYVEARRLRNEILRIQAAGEPLTLKDMAAKLPKVREEDDAGPYYEAALALLRDDTSLIPDASKTMRHALSQWPTSRPAPEAATTVDRLLANNALTLDMLDRAARQPACSFSVGADLGIGHCLDRLAPARQMARLLSLRALHLASKGQGDAAAESLVCLLRTLRIFDRQPMLISILVKVACMSLASEDTGTVLQVAPPSDSALARLQDELLALDQPAMLEQMMLADRAYGLETMREVVSHCVPTALPGEPLATMPQQWPSPSFWSNPIEEHMVVGYLHDMARLVHQSRRPLHEAVATMERGTGADSYMGRIMTPSLVRACELTAKGLADVRCAAVAIMVERYQRKHGRLPAELKELVGEYAKVLPLDPFTGKDLLYRQNDSGYVIYSVSEDRQDNSGEVTVDVKDKSPRDTGIRVHLTPRK